MKKRSSELTQEEQKMTLDLLYTDVVKTPTKNL